MRFLRALLVILMVVVAVSCGYHGNHSDLDIESAQEPLTPNGAIQPTQTISPGSEITAGTMEGGFSVTADGQASYQIPIWVPPAPMGMQPSLSLNYNSNRGSGPVGVGWSLDGFPLSQITRCGRTVAIDGNAAPVAYSDNIYCLDGKRLIRVAAGEFRTERDEFTKVVLSGPEIAPTSFTAYMKNGWILTYGGSSTSRLSGTRKILTVATSTSPATVQSSGTVTYAWALDTVQDRTNAITGLVANKMTITYATTTGTTTRYSSMHTFVEFFPTKVEYAYGANGTTAHRSVNLVYASTPRSDASLRFISGLPVKASKQLASIDLYGPNPTTTGLLKQYMLGYETAPTSGRPRLASVKECDAATTRICKTATTFSYEDGSNDFVEHIQDLAGEPVPDPFMPLTVTDIDGDGKDDVIFRKPLTGAVTNGTIYYTYRLSNLTAASAQGPASGSPFKPFKAATFASPTGPVRYDAGLVILDVDGDGRSDVSIMESPGFNRTGNAGANAYRDLFRFNGGFVFRTDTGSGVAPDTLYNNLLPMPLYVADMNGDGLPETVDTGPPDIRDSANNSYAPLLLRRNSGGTLGARTTISAGSGSTQRNYTIRSRPVSYPVETGRVIAASGENAYVADIDGSGRQAVLLVDSSYQPNGSQLNTSGFRYRAFYASNPPSLLDTVNLSTLQVTSRSQGSRYIMLDVNGDGLTDALRVDVQTAVNLANGVPTTFEATSSNFRINTGAGFDGAYLGNITSDTDPSYWVTFREDSGVEVADMNQDGLPDIVLMGQAKANNGTMHRSTIKVLKALSGPDGTATAAHFAAGASPKVNGAENAAAPPVVWDNPAPQPDTYGPTQARIGDFNGDGLADIILLQSGWDKLRVYVHQGKKADLMKGVTDGLGARITIDHASIADPAVYKRGRFGVTVPGTNNEATWEPNADCRYPLSCATKGRWVVKSYSTTTDHGIQGPPETRSFEYAEGRTDALRGWLGFAQRVETDPHRGKIITSYENWVKVGSNYPYAFLPKQHGYVVLEPYHEVCDSCAAYRAITTNTYEYVESTATTGAKTFRTRLKNSASSTHFSNGLQGPQDNVLVSMFFAMPAWWTPLSSANNAISAFTTYDDPVDSQLTLPTELVTTHNDYFSNSTSNWLIGRLRQTSATSAAGGKTATRTTSWSYYSNTKLPNTVIVEPTGGNDVRSVTTYTRGTGGLGQVTSTTIAATATADDPLGPGGLSRTASTVYDTVDGVFPTSVTTSGLTTSFAYHGGLGVLAQVADVNGIITTRRYDGFGRFLQETTPQRGTISVGYQLAQAPSGASQSVVDVYNAQAPAFTIVRTEQGAGQTSVTYNQRGHEVLRQDLGGDGQMVHQLTTYTDFDGQVASTSLPFRTASPYQITAFEYDNLGRVKRTILPDSKQYSFSYSPQSYGLKTTTQNPRGYYRHVVQDDRGRRASSIEPGPNGDVSTTYGYGPFGQLAKVVLPAVLSSGGTLAGSTTLTYDAMGRRVELNDADAGLSKRFYNAFGEVVKEIDASNKVTTFMRDSLGRVTQTSTTGDPGPNTYVWDPPMGKGQLDNSTSFDGVKKTYTYDAYGRPDTTKWTMLGGDFIFKSTWDPYGRLVLLNYPSLGTQTFGIEYGFDQAGQVAAVHRVGDDSTYWHVLHRTDDNRVDEEQLGSGFKTKRIFNPARGWLESIKSTKDLYSDVVHVAYGHDDNGNVTARRDYLYGTTEIFEYSPSDSLSKWIWETTSLTENYNPSPNGTIASRIDLTSGSTLSYDYWSTGPAGGNIHTGGMHAVQQTTGSIARQMFYDTKGNQTTTFSGATVEYNSLNLPKTITGPLTYFTYDAEGARASKGIKATLYAGGLYERRAVSGGAVLHVFYIPAGGRIVAQDTWVEKAGVFTRADVLYLHDDIIGSVVGVSSNGIGKNRTLYRYDPYGRRIGPTNPQFTVTNPVTSYSDVATGTSYTMNLGFTGHEMDDEFGLINMKGRIFDPKLARFLTPDPVVPVPSKPAGWDRYAYVMNNPLGFTDPSGYSPEDPPGDRPTPIGITIGTGKPANSGGGGGGGGGSGGYSRPTVPASGGGASNPEPQGPPLPPGGNSTTPTLPTPWTPAAPPPPVAPPPGLEAGGSASVAPPAGCYDDGGAHGGGSGGAGGGGTGAQGAAGMGAGETFHYTGHDYATWGGAYLRELAFAFGTTFLPGGFAMALERSLGARGIVAAATVEAEGAFSRVLSFTERNLVKGFMKHGGNFGLSGNWNAARSVEFSRAINQFINEPAVVQISGTYRGNAVTHFFNPATGVNVITTPSGEYVSGWSLSVEQMENLLRAGALQ